MSATISNNMDTAPLLSIVSPVYRGEKMVSELVLRIINSLHSVTENYEIILVNDASPDNSWNEIVKQCNSNPRVKGINLSRNFGQHNAISAGLQFVNGEWIIVMDCDLQDRPEEIPNLFKKSQEGFDIVFGRRSVRKDSLFKKSTSSFFYKVFSALSGIESDKTIANFGIYHKQVIDEFNKMPEQSRFFPSQIKYLGFKSTAIDIEHGERAQGKSSYNLLKRVHLGFDVIISNSNKPLKIAVITGIFMSAISFILALYNIVAKMIGVIQVPGYTTTVFSIWFVGGILLFVMGILGVYIGKIYDQVKGRQFFIIKEKVNL